MTTKLFARIGSTDGTLAMACAGVDGCAYQILNTKGLYSRRTNSTTEFYRRVADTLGVDPSYVSRVANGKKMEPKILRAVVDELYKIQRLLK
jgi:hypothetical protein